MAAFLDRQHSSRILLTQVTAASGAASVPVTNAFSAQTRQVRVSFDSTGANGVWIKIGDGAQTAAATDTFLPQNTVDYFTVNPGQSIAFISTSTSSGLFCVAEMI